MSAHPDIRIKKAKGERGQSLVELALSITILLTILAGIVDIGSAFFIWIEMRDSAQEGAVYASINPEPAKEAVVVERMLYSTDRPLNFKTEYDANRLTYEIIRPNPLCSGQPITVKLHYLYTIVMPFTSMVIPPGADGNPQTIELTTTVTNTILNSSTTGCP